MPSVIQPSNQSHHAYWLKRRLPLNRDLLRQIAVILTFLFTIATNSLANIAAIGGRNTGEISDMFPNFFTPPGYVFAIWGVIYLGLAAFTVYQALPAQRENPQLRQIGWLFVITDLLNGTWIFAWHYLLIPISWVMMIWLLITLLVIYERLGHDKLPRATPASWLVSVPFSIYTAWITVATIANTTVLLQVLGFNGGPLPETVWSAAVIVVGAAITAYVVYTRRDPAFAAVVIWAYVGIVVKYVGVDVVTITAGVMAAVVLAVLIGGLLRRGGGTGRMVQGQV